MKNRIVLGLAALIMSVSGCATTGAYTRTGGGWISDFKEVYFATPSGQASKMGMACTKNILGVAFGDASLEAAKRDGGITNVSSVDSEITNILYVYGKNCTIARGN
jgi:hypothetical protein